MCIRWRSNWAKGPIQERQTHCLCQSTIQSPFCRGVICAYPVLCLLFFLLPSFPLSPPSLSLCLISFWTDSHFCRQTHTSTQREWTKKTKSLALSSRGLFSLFFLRHNFHFFPLTWLHSPLRTSFFPPLHHPHPLWLHPLIYSYIVLLLLFFHLPCKEK